MPPARAFQRHRLSVAENADRIALDHPTDTGAMHAGSFWWFHPVRKREGQFIVVPAGQRQQRKRGIGPHRRQGGIGNGHPVRIDLDADPGMFGYMAQIGSKTVGDIQTRGGKPLQGVSQLRSRLRKPVPAGENVADSIRGEPANSNSCRL